MKIVQKYGGSSLADPECVRRVAGRVIRDAEGNQMLVVVSAQGKTTDAMTQNYMQYSDCFPSRESDAALICGEQISAALLTATIQSLGYSAISLNGAQVPILVTDFHGDGRIDRIDTSRIRKEWKHGNIVVVTGFQGINNAGDFVTLGRGGSDTSAVALAAALNADRCQIFTDVDGVYSTDPRRVSTAVRFDTLCSSTMLDLASGGAKVLNPRAAQLVIQYGIPTEILSSFSDRKGTVLAPDAPRKNGITVNRSGEDADEITITLSSQNDTSLIWRLVKTVSHHLLAARMYDYKLLLTVQKPFSEKYLLELHDLLYSA